MVAATRRSPLGMLLVVLACPAGGVLAAEPTSPPRPLPVIDPSTSVANLLPVAPKAIKEPVYLGDDLARVPEVMFEALPGHSSPPGKLTTPLWVRRKAQTVAAVLHLNAREEDGFLKALVRSRPDLSGVPFLMGKACRAEEDRAKTIKYTAQKMRRGDNPSFYLSVRYQRAHIAVAAQNLIGHDDRGKAVALRALTSTRHPDATRALARAAAYSPDEAVRTEAIKALAARPVKESTEVLVGALRYPWPAVARNAAQAIVELKRTDLIPQLKAVLDEPDPRGPRAATAGGKKVTVAHEVVRINHLRNCMLCHAPAEPEKTPEGVLVADVPLPSESVPETGPYSDDSQKTPSRLANLLVRIDVTYLRQDFSAMGEVPDASPWPAKQRFDYVVRKRVLTPTEAGDLRKRLKGESPYHQAAAKALRALTDRDLRAGPAQAEGTR